MPPGFINAVIYCPEEEEDTQFQGSLGAEDAGTHRPPKSLVVYTPPVQHTTAVTYCPEDDDDTATHPSEGAEVRVHVLP